MVGLKLIHVSKKGPRNQLKHQEIEAWMNNHYHIKSCGIISYPLFASTDMGIYPHAASRYHMRPKAKRGITMLSVDKSESPLWRHQWRSFVFISHADDVKHEIRLHISRLLTNQKRESAQSMG